MGIVYVAINDGMYDKDEDGNFHNIVKIGLTRKDESVEERMKSLNTSSAPYPFECIYAVDVGDKVREVERQVHKILDERRIRKGKYQREFFRIEPDHAVDQLKMLELMGGVDVTPNQLDTVEDEDDKRIVREKIKKRKKLTFGEVGIPVGSILQFRSSRSDEEITSEVADDRRIKFRGEMTSLSRAAATILQERGSSHRKRPDAVAGTLYWLYEGIPLDKIRRDRSGIKSSVGQNVVPNSDAVESQNREDGPSRRKAPQERFTFSMLQIPMGSELALNRDPAIKAKVVGDREIECDGKRGLLGKITKDIFANKIGIGWKTVRGTNEWSFQDETLTDRRMRIKGSSVDG